MIFLAILLNMGIVILAIWSCGHLIFGDLKMGMLKYNSGPERLQIIKRAQEDFLLAIAANITVMGLVVAGVKIFHFRQIYQIAYYAGGILLIAAAFKATQLWLIKKGLLGLKEVSSEQG